MNAYRDNSRPTDTISIVPKAPFIARLNAVLGGLTFRLAKRRKKHAAIKAAAKDASLLPRMCMVWTPAMY